MPLKLKLWKKSNKYNVQMATATSFPNSISASSQPNLHHPFVANQDPIYANGHHALSLMEALNNSYVTTVQLQRPSLTSSFENQSERHFDERLKYLPAYREPPEYETYVKRKYVLQGHAGGSLPFLPVSHVDHDMRYPPFSSMQHHLNQVNHHHFHQLPHHHVNYPHNPCCPGSDTL